MIKRGSKQRAERANLRIREKTNGFLGLKQGAGRANLRKKKEKRNGLVDAKNRGRGGAGQTNLRKKRKRMDK